MDCTVINTSAWQWNRKVWDYVRFCEKEVDVPLESLVIKLFLFTALKYFHFIFGAKHIRNGKIHIRNTVVRKHYRRTFIIFKASIQKVWICMQELTNFASVIGLCLNIKIKVYKRKFHIKTDRKIF
jgi:hypothetical protein